MMIIITPWIIMKGKYHKLNINANNANDMAIVLTNVKMPGHEY